MIEDLQDELHREQPAHKEKSRRKGGLFLFAFIIWLVYAVVIILSSLPRIIASVRESDIIQTVGKIEVLKAGVQKRNAKLCFAVPKADGTTAFVICTQQIEKTGASEYHDVIEGLLAGPGYEALSAGAISFIKKGTSLLGLSVSESTAFVNLSESFTDSGSSWGSGGLETACCQIARTLQALDTEIKNIVILADGKEFTL
ncbi:MAG: GerMN domain-containing protein [Spirochaetales bacterium]